MHTGIGQKSAIALSKAGWSLTLFARRLEELLITKQMCADPDQVLVVQGDVTDEHGVKHMFRKTVEHFGACFWVAAIIRQLEGPYAYRTAGPALQRKPTLVQ